ncbi:hypothetical protein B7486_14030 [cyanobacterium TDX16]|nr:hypothetical protein B7486_14030 [cyanobacterium TDX16]
MSEQDKKKQIAKWVNAHADGLLTPEQQAQFDRALASNAYLRNEVAKQARIDEALKRQFAAPSADEVLRRALGEEKAAPQEKKAKKPKTPKAPRRDWSPIAKYASLAAAVLLMVGGGWWFWLYQPDIGGQTMVARSSDAPPSGPQSRDLKGVYDETVASGFTPKWVCKTDKQFFLTTYNRFGRGLLLAALPPDIKALGWSYGLAISPKTAYLLADVRGHKTIVFIDDAAYDGKQRPPTDCALYMHYRRIDDLILYEISDLDQPAVLEYFYSKDIPEEWKSSALRP